mmetsp:Transcript_1850/g.5408  ORF Transcript_1850/g.5408 Transcript_1850/m.5408 type:complete len:411 (-) Transcript_1850:1078-2310(-)|eukprot:CAMPEP_0181050664 /NCGR_PEP_ID=MMETSP1070-20121207/16636_1 /TAXON_ID=265543 /ORGANISM="Minutocellus polymorphus, Strain NH13" /LENGTH=410 /DNA_ID=CAMNT_0023129623 /DNA_START=119 /DNA_END=1351 /DNA_ORIENTATION=-
MSTSPPVPTAKRRRTDSPETATELCQDAISVPTLTADTETGLISSEAFFEAYEKHQAVLLKPAQNQQLGKKNALSWRGLAALFDSLTDDDQGTFCIENAGANGDGKDGNKKEKPADFLAPSGDEQDEERRGYCSFLVQSPKILADTLDRLPLPELPLKSNNGDSTSADEKRMRYGPCLWLFFGRNAPKETTATQDLLDGRPEHTDSVSHDGTFHYQLSGSKTWHIRPTTELIKRRSNNEEGNGKFHKSTDAPASTGVAGSEEGRVTVKCNEGDVFILNTRLWWHKTVIPPQPICKVDGKAVPSISYAREFSFAALKGTSDSKMSNLDGLYAADTIEKDTVVFTEEDMPDCELHRSEDPNCELVQLDNGMGAIVSRRAIAAGEFFCIAESSDEEDEYEEDEEGEEVVEEEE